jgi:hypothetical protein
MELRSLPPLFHLESLLELGGSFPTEFQTKRRSIVESFPPLKATIQGRELLSLTY